MFWKKSVEGHSPHSLPSVNMIRGNHLLYGGVLLPLPALVLVIAAEHENGANKLLLLLLSILKTTLHQLKQVLSNNVMADSAAERKCRLGRKVEDLMCSDIFSLFRVLKEKCGRSFSSSFSKHDSRQSPSSAVGNRAPPPHRNSIHRHLSGEPLLLDNLRLRILSAEGL